MFTYVHVSTIGSSLAVNFQVFIAYSGREKRENKIRVYIHMVTAVGLRKTKVTSL